MASESTARDVTYDLERLISDLEFENQQYVKQIECERQEIENLETQFEECKLMIKHEEAITPQLDDTIKTYHRQYTHNRDNLQSLRQTFDVLQDHEDALIKKLEIIRTKNEEESKEHEQLRMHYEDKWLKYKECYENFPKAKELIAVKQEQEKYEKEYRGVCDKKNALESAIAKAQFASAQKFQPYKSLNEFVVKFAEGYVKCMRKDEEISQLKDVYASTCADVKQRRQQQQEEKERKEKEEREKMEEEERRKQEEEEQKIREEEQLKTKQDEMRQQQLQEIMAAQVKQKQLEIRQSQQKQLEMLRSQQAERQRQQEEKRMEMMRVQRTDEDPRASGMQRDVLQAKYAERMQQQQHTKAEIMQLQQRDRDIRMQQNGFEKRSAAQAPSRGPAGEQSSKKGPSGEQSSEKGPAGEPSTRKGPAGEQSSKKGPSGERPSGKGPAGEPSTRKGPAGEQSSKKGPSGERPSGKGPAGEPSTRKGPAGEQSSRNVPLLTIPRRQHSKIPIRQGADPSLKLCPPRSQPSRVERSKDMAPSSNAASIIPQSSSRSSDAEAKPPVVSAAVINSTGQSAASQDFHTASPVIDLQNVTVRKAPEGAGTQKDTQRTDGSDPARTKGSVILASLDEQPSGHEGKMDVDECTSPVCPQPITSTNDIVADHTASAGRNTLPSQANQKCDLFDNTSAPKTPGPLAESIYSQDPDDVPKTPANVGKIPKPQKTPPASQPPDLSMSPMSESGSIDLDKEMEKARKFRSKSPGTFVFGSAFFGNTSATEKTAAPKTCRHNEKTNLFGAGDDSNASTKGFSFDGGNSRGHINQPPGAVSIFGEEVSDGPGVDGGFNFNFGAAMSVDSSPQNSGAGGGFVTGFNFGGGDADNSKRSASNLLGLFGDYSPRENANESDGFSFSFGGMTSDSPQPNSQPFNLF